jgi:hypothetical protein
MVKISKIAKNAIFWGSAFVAYRLYKLYELGNNIIYKPVGVSFKRGATVNDFVIRVKMEILNPANTIVKLRGIDGQLLIRSQPVGTFNSGPFQITGGLSYFYLDFKVDPKNIGAELIQAVLAKKIPVLTVSMTVKLPFFSTTSVFDVNPGTLPTSEVLVK